MRMPRARLVVAGFLVLAATSAAACSSTAPPSAPQDPSSARAQEAAAGQAYPQQYAPQPGYPPGIAPYGSPSFAEPQPATVPDAVAQIDRAEQALALLLDGKAASGVAAQEASPSATAAPAATSPAMPLTQGDACTIACAALASMKRSADHLCGMAGETDLQCGGARARVSRAEQRVTAACPACAAK